MELTVRPYWLYGIALAVAAYLAAEKGAAAEAIIISITASRYTFHATREKVFRIIDEYEED